MKKWLPVVGYEGFYSVSSDGEIRREEHSDKNGHVYKQRLLSITPQKSGYARVHLSKDGEAKWHSLHRIVAEAFIPKVEGCNIVNHIDNNPSNNHADNLEWTTYKGNMQHASKQGRMKGNPENLKKASEARKVPVIATDEDGKEIWFSSQSEAAHTLGITRGHIAEACRKEYGYKKVGGYEFKYADEDRRKKAVPHKIGMTKEQLSELTRQRMIGNKHSKGVSPSQGNRQATTKALGKPVLQLTKDGSVVSKYLSCNIAKQKTGISHINDAAAGKRKSAGGYIWRFIDE